MSRFDPPEYQSKQNPKIFSDPLASNTMYSFMNNIEKTLIQDEQLLRLLVYKPEGFDENLQLEIPDPLSSKLPNLVDESSDEYWILVEDRVRKGDKRTDKDEDSKCVLYLQEGRDRSIFRNAFEVNQEVIVSILIHEDYEKDWRMSRIRDRVYELLVHTREKAGFGLLESVGSDPREAPKSFRRIDYRLVFKNNKRIGDQPWK